MDFEMGQKAGELRGELRELVKAHVPEHFLGAFTDNPADLETAQQYQPLDVPRQLDAIESDLRLGNIAEVEQMALALQQSLLASHMNGRPFGAQHFPPSQAAP